jgi:hypothetical protein
VSDAQLLPVIWTLGSMVIAVLMTLIFSPARADHFRSTLAGRIAEQVARLLYFVGLPYAALLTQSITTVDLGLAGTNGSILGWSTVDWLHGFSTWLTLGLLLLISIGIAARQMARTGAPLGVDVRSSAAIVIDGVYTEIHWAFYRAAPFILLGDVYWATLIGVILISVEWLVVIARNGLGREPEEVQSWIGQLLLLSMSATLFILTRNVWLTIALHLVVEVALKALTSRLAASTTQDLTGA